jgi:hypothetical protein
MPRTNRVARAANNPNPISSCIMLVQEKLKVLRRIVAGCNCTELEEELLLLRNEYGKLQEAYQKQTKESQKYQFKSQETLASFNARINYLLQVIIFILFSFDYLNSY